MTDYVFYKAVQDMHIRPHNSPMFGTWTGIKVGGLDPTRRNAFGGATLVALVQTGRKFSPDDATGVGQCLTGNIEYAKGYCTTDNHVLLRIKLDATFLNSLVQSAANHYKFDSMQDAVEASECTAITVIPPANIEYSTGNGADDWEAIRNFNNPTYHEWFDASGDASDDDW